MIKALTVIVLCLLLGDAVNRLTGLPLPGPVIGMLLLLALLIYRGGPDHAMKQACHGLLHNMALLFVPASAGLITELPLLQPRCGAHRSRDPGLDRARYGGDGWVMHLLTRGGAQ